MKSILMIIGCVLGVIGGAADYQTQAFGTIPLNWLIATVGVAFLIAAFVMDRSSKGPGVAVSAASQSGMGEAQKAMSRVSTSVREVLDRARTLPMADLVTQIDSIINKDIFPVHGAQTDLIRADGFPKYAAYTGPWAAGERMVYRAWSAATDGHRPEVIASLEEAMLHFDEAARSA